MIKEFVEAWDKHKGDLEHYFITHKQGEYDSYEKLVKLLFEHVINPELTIFQAYDLVDITVLGGDDYQGTYVFIIHRRESWGDPYVDDYVYTHTFYGSCSGCDTLQGIHSYDYNEYPNDEQVADYMTLCLHLLQRCHRMVGTEDGE